MGWSTACCRSVCLLKELPLGSQGLHLDILLPVLSPRTQAMHWPICIGRNWEPVGWRPLFACFSPRRALGPCPGLAAAPPAGTCRSGTELKIPRLGASARRRMLPLAAGPAFVALFRSIFIYFPQLGGRRGWHIRVALNPFFWDIIPILHWVSPLVLSYLDVFSQQDVLLRTWVGAAP